MDPSKLFELLFHAESETEVLEILRDQDLLKAGLWRDLGNLDNNFGIVSNQQQDPTGAVVEKLINAIDANLMRACFAAGVDPEGKDAPQSMQDAVERFFGVKGGRIGDLLPKDQRALAELTQLVAVGSKTDPCYLIIDRGEGQTPRMQPDTFLSLAKSNKMKIPFVQGKFNAGGTGVLPFCGDNNLQLIVSRRFPKAPNRADDDSGDRWGFTIVRRLRPAEGRRSSVYVYLAPEGRVPSFAAPHIMALPGQGRANNPAQAYSLPLEYGSVVKLYNYKWSARSLATTEARYELERYLHSPCLPFRVVETRDYRANYYSTSVVGIWATIATSGADAESPKVEPGFPASEQVNLKELGALPTAIAAYREETNMRHVAHGVHFVINGQSHGQLPADFVRRHLAFPYLQDTLLVSVDCTQMAPNVREDLFMASRDRLRRNDTYDDIVSTLTRDLKSHPGLRELNAARRAQKLQQSLEQQEDVTKTLNELLNADPALRALFNLGDSLITNVGPAQTEVFKGKRFPTFFRIENAPKVRTLVKPCPMNRTCRVEFVTDAMNDYFSRPDQAGELTIKPDGVLDHGRLWNGVYSGRFRPWPGGKAGDSITVSVSVTDPARGAQGRDPFESEFELRLEKEFVEPSPLPGKPVTPKKPHVNGKGIPRLALPNVKLVREPEWPLYKPPFDAEQAFRVVQGDEDAGTFDFFVNLDCSHLLGYLRATKDEEKDLVVYWFKWGLTLCSLGMLHGYGLIGKDAKSSSNEGSEGDYDAVEVINRSVNGIAGVIIPIIKNLHHPLSVPAEASRN